MENLPLTKRIKGLGLIKFWPALLIAGFGLIWFSANAWSNEPTAVADKVQIVVYKTPACGCCDKWVDHLEQNDFDVTVNNVPETYSIRERFGVPHELASCHTAVVGDYWVEGHVPADLVQQLLMDQPENIKGISVPGMPQGSPGMESPYPVRYQIISFDGQGHSAIYASRDGQHAH